MRVADNVGRRFLQISLIFMCNDFTRMYMFACENLRGFLSGPVRQMFSVVLVDSSFYYSFAKIDVQCLRN